MKARIVSIEEIRVAGKLVEADSQKGDTDFPGAWKEYFEVLSKTGNLDWGREYFGYSKNYMERGGRTTFDYLISMRIDDYREVPHGFIKEIIPGGRYAIYTYRGELDSQRVREFYDNIYFRWLREDGLTPSRNECFEYYDSRFKEGTEESEYDVWVPVI